MTMYSSYIRIVSPLCCGIQSSPWLRRAEGTVDVYNYISVNYDGYGDIQVEGNTQFLLSHIMFQKD